MGEDLDTVRRLYDAFSRQDWGAVVEHFHPEVTADFSRSGIPDVGTYHGRAGLREAWTRWRGVWDRYDVEPDDIRQVGDRVLALIRVQARSKGQGMATEIHAGDVFTIRDGLIVEFVTFLDRDAALREVGLG